MRKLRPNDERSKLAVIFLWIMIGAGIIVLVSEINQVMVIQSFKDGTIPFDRVNEVATQSDLFVGVSALVYGALQIGCAIVFIMWFRRAYFNLHQLIRSGLRMSEGWAAGAWFIPIYNLWGPYNVANDLFTETENILVSYNLTEKKQSRHTIKGWWWALWIIGNISVSIENQMSKTTEIDTLITTSYMAIGSSIITIGAAFLGIQMIKSYSEMEELLPEIADVSELKGDNLDLLDSSL